MRVGIKQTKTRLGIAVTVAALVGSVLGVRLIAPPVKPVALDARTVVTTKPFPVTVIDCQDGDTLRVRVLGVTVPVMVRVRRVDAPELAQPFGREARDYCQSQLRGRRVSVVPYGGDAFGRVLGDVRMDGTDYGEGVIQAGLAWWYNRYDMGNVGLARLEDAARKAGVGLWRDATPEPPWKFRKGKGKP